VIIARTALEIRHTMMSKNRFSLTFSFLGQCQRISFTDKHISELTFKVDWSLVVHSLSFRVKMTFVHIS